MIKLGIVSLNSLNIMLHLAAVRNVSMSDLFDKLRIRLKKHDVEMLYSMNGLQRLPILEPDILSRAS